MSNLSSKKILVYDYGLAIPVAQRLARDFGKVFYYMPWKSSFPTSHKAMVGAGLPDVERVEEFFDYIDKVDLIYFPDIYDADLQRHLRKLGHVVFGSGSGEDYEIDRWAFLKELEKLGLAVAKTVKLKGLDAAREYLKDKKNKYVKSSKFRGDVESFKWEDFDQSEGILDDLAVRIGARKREIDILVQDPIPGDVEIGYDGWVIDGKYPSVSGIGYEVKNKGYVGRISTYEQLPNPIKSILDKSAPMHKNKGFRGQFSNEIRISEKGVPYPIDFTPRMPSPPGCLMTEWYTNFSETAWDIANGVMPTPKPAAKYGVELCLSSDWIKTKYMAIDWPKEIDKYVKLANYAIIDGQGYCVPVDGQEKVGSVIAYGDSIDAASKKCLEYAKQIRAHTLTYSESVFETGKKYIEAGRKVGVAF